MPTIMVAESPDTAEARTLIEALDASLIPLDPLEDHDGYRVETLLEEGVACCVIRHDGVPAGCGGLTLVSTDDGDSTRLDVRPACRGLGLGRRLRDHLAADARTPGVHVRRLETGMFQPEARRLDERDGFQRIPALGDSEEGPVHRLSEQHRA